MWPRAENRGYVTYSAPSTPIHRIQGVFLPETEMK